MPEKKTLERAAKDKREGKAPTTQAGEFIREEMHHIRAGKHGARSPQQAIAIGLSKARRAGVDLPPRKKGKTSSTVRHKVERDYAIGHGAQAKSPSVKRSKSRIKALKKEGHSAASHSRLARQAHRAAEQRSAGERSEAAKKAARTRAKIKA
jgi:hypothetical protein